jgi:hypothetical protein
VIPFISKQSKEKYMLTRVILLELGQIIDVIIDGDVQVIRLVMRCNLGSCENLRHDGNNKSQKILVTGSELDASRRITIKENRRQKRSRRNPKGPTDIEPCSAI